MLYMLSSPCRLRAGRFSNKFRRRKTYGEFRSFLTLAIESSCDDSSVALIETENPSVKTSDCNSDCGIRAELLYHEKITSRNTQWRGIHPLHSLEAHEVNLPQLVKAALKCPAANGRQPDLVAATRGPGMKSSLRTGLNLAKGLALAWDVPFIGVHHMQAHALTPRLETALSGCSLQTSGAYPTFPFLSILASGGHTLLLRSESLLIHQEISTTSDIAVGDCLDKVARTILPEAMLDSIPDAGYARLLEPYAFPGGADTYCYDPPRRREQEVQGRATQWGWSIKTPLIDTRAMKFSFAGIETAVKKVLATREQVIDDDERRELARRAMEAAFELIASRTMLALEAEKASDTRCSTIVLSGGVASNLFFRHMLRAFLDIRGFGDVALVCPRPALCVDNAAMIAWTGFEMFEHGWSSDLACLPLAKWPLTSSHGGSGILEAGGWLETQANGSNNNLQAS